MVLIYKGQGIFSLTLTWNL